MKNNNAKTKKTVVMVVPDLKGNGAERVILTLATGFKQRNFEVHIIVFNKFIELEINHNFEFKIHQFKYYYRWMPRAIRGFITAKILDRFIINRCGVPNIVLSNLLPIDRILCRSKLDNVFLIVHTIISKDYFNGKKYLNTSDKVKSELANIYTKKPIISVSKGVMADVKTLFNPSLDTHYIYTPIDVGFIQTMAGKYTPKLSNYIIHIGKFNEAKRHDVLIRAYHRSNINKPLILLGQGKRGEAEKRVKALVASLNISDKVFFMGFQSNPYPYIKNADLMVLSSEYEGLSLVILEAIALNIPVISTDCPSGPGEILPAKNLIPVNDIDLLAAKIVDASNNLDEYKTTLKDEFHLDCAIDKYIELIG